MREKREMKEKARWGEVKSTEIEKRERRGR